MGGAPYFGFDEGGWPSAVTYSLPQKTAIGHKCVISWGKEPPTSVNHSVCTL